MRLISLSLRGAIGIREGLGLDEIRIDFDNIEPGIVALVAPNGHGKTTLLENLHPFRKLVSRDGKLADHFYLRDSHRVLEWEQDGHVYLAKLLLDGVKGAAESYLYRDGEPLNDGKNTTYDKAIAEVVGDEGLFFSSLFRSQNADSVTDMTAGERKKLLSALLGFEKYETFRAITDEHRVSAEARARELETEIAVIRERVSARDALVQEIAKTEERIAELQRERNAVPEHDLESIQGEIATRKARLVELERRSAELVTAIANPDTSVAAQFLSQHAELEAELRDLVAKRERLEKIVANEATIKAGLAKIEELRGLIEAERARHAAHIAAKDRRREIMIEHQARIDKAQEELSKWDRLEIQTSQAAQAVRDEYDRFEKPYLDLVQRIDNAAERLTQVPCHGMDIQSGCPLMRDAVELVGGREKAIRGWKTWVHDWQDRANAANVAATEASDEHLRAGERFKKTVDVMEEALNSFDASHDESLSWAPFELARLTEALKIEEGKRWSDLATECAGAVSAMAELTASIAKAEQVSIEKKREYVKALEDQEADSARLDAEYTSTLDEINEIEKKLEQAGELYAAAKNAEARRVSFDREIATLTGSVNSARTRLAGMEDSETRLSEIETTLSRVRADVYEWTMLSRACGPKGIPALELDSAGPRISDIANDLLSSTFGSEFRIEFETTRLTQSGDQTEAFEIMVYSGDEARKIELLSGGQRVWIEAAISQAISLYIREQSGLDLRTSFLDEADGALDSDNAFKYLSMLRASHNRSGAHHTIVITHRQELLSLIPSQLHLVRGEGVVAC